MISNRFEVPGTTGPFHFLTFHQLKPKLHPRRPRDLSWITQKQLLEASSSPGPLRQGDLHAGYCSLVFSQLEKKRVIVQASGSKMVWTLQKLLRPSFLSQYSQKANQDISIHIEEISRKSKPIPLSQSKRMSHPRQYFILK